MTIRNASVTLIRHSCCTDGRGRRHIVTLWALIAFKQSHEKPGGDSRLYGLGSILGTMHRGSPCVNLLGDETSSPMERLRWLCHCDEVLAAENFVSGLVRRCVPVTKRKIYFPARSIKSSVLSCTAKRRIKANTGSSRVIYRLLIDHKSHKTANRTVHCTRTYMPNF